MRKRRGRGEGAIFQRGDGIWTASLRLGYDGTKARRRTVYGKTKSEVQEKLLNLQQQRGLIQHLDSKRITFGEFADRWLNDYVRLQCRATTLALYRSLLRVHVLPRLSKTHLDKISPLILQQLYANLEIDGSSARLIQMVHARLHKLFAVAVKWKLVTSNPCAMVDPPRAPKRSMQHLSSAQCKSLLTAARDDKLYALYVVAISTGLRQGELIGLRWEDLDLKTGTVSVQRSVQEVDGQPTVQQPKTSKSRRMVVLPRFAVSALKKHQAEASAAGLAAGGWVFTDARGGLLRKSNLIRRSFKPLLVKANLPEIRFHDLRHTAATLLLERGTNPKVVQEMLGHAHVGLTLDTYSHVTPSLQRESARAMDELLGESA
jgi:integrase